MINLTWDYRYPQRIPYTVNHPDESQEDWNNTLITAINQINATIFKARIPNSKRIVVPVRFKHLFEGLIYYKKINEISGELCGRYNVDFEDINSEYINVCGVPLKIDNFNNNENIELEQ